MSAYPGRIVFDHLPKTAGQSVNAWLREALGPGAVTDNLSGEHDHLIARYGGLFSVISGHINFIGLGLDPRYQYVTCLRDPIDRAVSWLYYLVNNHEDADIPGWRPFAEEFIADPLGWDADENCATPEIRVYRRRFERSISNSVVAHFSSIDAMTGAEEPTSELRRALSILNRYTLCGLYEEMPRFLSDFSKLLGLQSRPPLRQLNVTRARPRVDGASSSLRRRLEELNDLDIALYESTRRRAHYKATKASKTPSRSKGGKSGPRRTAWTPMPSRSMQPKRVMNVEFTIQDIRHTERLASDEQPSFSVEFSIAAELEDIVIQVSVHDSSDRVILKLDTRQLATWEQDIRSGCYRLDCKLPIYLEPGSHSADLVFSHDGLDRVLAIMERILEIRVESASGPRAGPDVVCALAYLGPDILQPVRDARGVMTCNWQPGQLAVGEEMRLPVTVVNQSSQHWPSLWNSRVSFSYRWLNLDGSIANINGLRTPIDRSVIRMGESVHADLRIKAPKIPGRYVLVAMPVQERICWFDLVDFTPLDMEINVVARDEPRVITPSDPRIRTVVGKHCDGSMSSSGRSGFVAYGPYIPAAAGRWRAVLEGDFRPSLGAISIDVTCGAAQKVLATSYVPPEGCSSLELHFLLDEAAEDLEARIWVDERAQVRLDRVTLQPLQAIAT